MNPGTAALDGVEVELKVPDTAASVAHNFTHSETLALQNFLGAAPEDTDKLSAIAQFVRGEKTEFSDVELLHAVRTLETKLGLPALGQKRIDQVYAYVKLQGQIDGLERDRNALLR